MEVIHHDQIDRLAAGEPRIRYASPASVARALRGAGRGAGRGEGGGVHDAKLLRLIAERLRPRERIRPSEWARRNVVLTPEQSPRPGPYNPDWKPWTPDLLDVSFDNPTKLGHIGVKPGQIGWSQVVQIRIGCRIATDPISTLMVTTDDDMAKKFADERIRPLIRRCPELRRLVQEAGRERRELLNSFPFPGGRLDIVGAGSESKLVGTPFGWVALDEFDVVCREFPGDPFVAAQVRTRQFRGQSLIDAFSHPKYWGEGVHKLFLEQSDMRMWVFDCPHEGCGEAVECHWFKVVRFRRVRDDGRPVPESAELVCPACQRAITDDQRARALWKPTQRAGGTGRFQRLAELSEEEAASRRWVGLWVPRLTDPDVTLRELAEGYVRAFVAGEKALAEWFGKDLGEPYRSQAAAISIEDVRKSFQQMPAVVVPGGQLGCKFVTAGADVQAPRENPRLYCAAIAFAATGTDFVVDLRPVTGFALWHEWLRHLDVPVDDGAGGGVQRHLGVSVAGIDDRFESGQVKDNCRLASVYSAASSARVELVPLGFAASSTLNNDNPVVLRKEEKRRHPTRPELGLIDMYDLHRHSWVDRVIRRLQEGRLVFLCPRPPDLEEHLTSQLWTPKRTPHTNWQATEMEWDLAPKRRDDWLMAIVYAYAVAAIKKGLDRIHLMGEAPPPAGRPRIVAPAWD